MSKFHSSVSRREFMKAISLAGAGVSAAAALAPGFQDLDELTASENTHTQHRWWVKERDYEDITTPIDWNVFAAWSATRYPAVPMVTQANTEAKARATEWMKQANLSGKPNCTTKDLGIWAAVNNVTAIPAWDGPVPASWGFDAVRHDATPEENLSILRAALHYFGAPRAGGIELDEHTKRLFDDGKWVWEDIDKGFMDAKKVYHIPNKCKYLVVWYTKQEYTQARYGIGEVGDDNRAMPLGYASNRHAYSHAPAVNIKAMTFVKALGYQAYSARFMAGMQANVPLGIFSGLAEQGRTAYSLSPDHGLSLRYMDYVLTDLPIAPSKPIDAGLVNFCKVCARCADVCPTNSVTKDNDISWEPVGPFNRTGFKGWHMNIQTCWDFGSPGNCCVCQTACPFNHPEASMVHPIIRATVGNTSIFNNFFARMDGFMKYSEYENGEESWWNRDLRTWKHDTLYGYGSAEGVW